MILEYGGHRHTNAEAFFKGISKVALFSDRGDVYAYDYTARIGLRLRNRTTGANGLVLQAAEVERVYSIPNQRLTLYTNTGAIAFRLDPAISSTGLQCRSLTYPDVSGAQLTTFLDVEIEMGMEIEERNPQAEILAFEESVSVSGGLPKYVYLPTSLGYSTRQVAQQTTPYVATQSGMVVGRRSRIGAARILFPNADMIARSLDFASPRRLRQGQYREFSTQWSYSFMSNQPLIAEPNIL